MLQAHLCFPCPGTGMGHFSKELLFLLQRMIFKSQDSGIRCTHCYGGMARAGGGCFQSTELQIIQTYAHTHIYTHIRTHIYNYTYVYIFTHICIYVYTCIYTYTHLNLYLLCILTTMNSHWYLPFPFNPKEFIQVPSCPYLYLPPLTVRHLGCSPRQNPPQPSWNSRLTLPGL